MMTYEETERFHARKHPRLANYDYSTPNYYFITICAHRKQSIFGQPGNLNSLGKIADEAFTEIEKHCPRVLIDKYVVMPNHVHAIVVLREWDKNLSVVLGQYKAYVSRKIHEIDPNLKVWQASFHDHIIRDQKGYERIWNYIDGNPGKWQDDCYFEPDKR